MAKQQKKPRSSKPNPEEDENTVRNLARYSGIAFEIVAFNLVLIWAGYKLDQYFGFRFPWMIITALLLSVAGTLYLIFKRLNT